MHIYFTLFGLTLPSYGIMIALGVVLANVIGLLFVKPKFKLDFNDFIILEAYCFLGAFLGAKLLYIAISFQEIDWSRITDFQYFNSIMQGGFVFYGGLIGGLLLVFIASKLHKIDSKPYVNDFIFLIPFIHSFGRIGCFLAGCCYGIPHIGVFAVTFPEGSLAPSGISLFPIQLVEAILLMFIALLIFFFDMRRSFFLSLELYLLLYGILRFILEFFRYDKARGSLSLFSTSQWISIIMVCLAIILLFQKQKFKNEVYL